MAGMQFEYDEKGSTFYYFLLAFYALILVPTTYFLWPYQKDNDDEKKKNKCQCDPCLTKVELLKNRKPWARTKRNATKIGLAVAWVGLALLAYKVSTIEVEHIEYDPFHVLKIDKGASKTEIKKAYRELSLIYHPDKETGDPKKFMMIAKAYEALTNEEARKNWEEYGNPDGPGATHFGIALPKWIVEKQNSLWVLAVYGLIFMVILPIAVGTWWYRSIQFSGDQVLLDTTQLYYYFFTKTPNMILKRVIMILAGSFEFEVNHNKEIVERPSDNEEIPLLMKELPHLDEKKKEKPLCFPYSLKARALLHAHFSRMDLPPKSLELDKQYILKKTPYLLNEMVNTVGQLVYLSHMGRGPKQPRLETIENIMKLSQMLVQGLWENKSPLLQLPHIGEDMLRHFQTKKRNVRSIRQFVQMDDEDRRNVLRTISDSQYNDILNVCASMPYITMKLKTEVVDDEDTSITAGSIVTVKCVLTRKPMSCLMDKLPEDGPDDAPAGIEDVDPPEEKEVDEDEADKNQDNANKNNKVWQKSKKKAKNTKMDAKKKKQQQQNAKAKQEQLKRKQKEEEEKAKASKEGTPVRTKKEKKRVDDDDEDVDDDMEDEGSEASVSEIENENESDVDEPEPEKKSTKAEREDDDDDWNKFQEEMKKENSLETKSKESHLVHCPYFPVEKYEWWWLYVADKKLHSVITMPIQICNLKEQEEVSVKFSAPSKPGLYTYTLCLRSDSYVDFDLFDNIRLNVKEAKKVENHPQWDISGDEDEEKDDDATDSDDYESEESDDD